MIKKCKYFTFFNHDSIEIAISLAHVKVKFHNTKCPDYSLIRQMILGDIFTILLSFTLHCVIFLHKHTSFRSRTSYDVISVILLVMRRCYVK